MLEICHIRVHIYTGHGTSIDPCAENYRGLYPFSEPETRLMANYIWPIRDKLLLYLSFHSYGQFWLLPWGFSYSVPSDYTDLASTEIPITIIEYGHQNLLQCSPFFFVLFIYFIYLFLNFSGCYWKWCN